VVQAAQAPIRVVCGGLREWTLIFECQSSNWKETGSAALFGQGSTNQYNKKLDFDSSIFLN